MYEIRWGNGNVRQVDRKELIRLFNEWGTDTSKAIIVLNNGDVFSTGTAEIKRVG